MDARAVSSRQSGHDAAAAATNRREVVRSLWAVCVDAQVCLRAYANRAAADACAVGGLGCGIGGCGQASAVLEVRDAAVQRERAARDETGRIGEKC
jgi:hypothetical protein